MDVTLLTGGPWLALSLSFFPYETGMKINLLHRLLIRIQLDNILSVIHIKILQFSQKD